MADLVVELYGTPRRHAHRRHAHVRFRGRAAAAVKASGSTAPSCRSRSPWRWRRREPRSSGAGTSSTSCSPRGGCCSGSLRGARARPTTSSASSARTVVTSPGRCRSGIRTVPGEPRAPRLDPLDAAGVAALLEHVQDFPLGNKPKGGKSSLAGVQDKIVLDPHPGRLEPSARRLPVHAHPQARARGSAHRHLRRGVTARAWPAPPAWRRSGRGSRSSPAYRPWSSSATTARPRPRKGGSTRKTSIRPSERAATRSTRGTAGR